MNDEGIRHAIDVALELTADTPAELRAAAFEAVLGHLLGNMRPQPYEATDDRSGVATEQPADDVAIPSARIVKKGTRNQQAVWAIMTLCNRGEAATTAATAIAKVIKDGLGNTPEDKTNLSNRLRGMIGDYVERTKSGRSYVYVCTPTANEIFSDGDGA